MWGGWLRLEMRTLRSSSRFTPAYDPLESEADRLLAQTCARLGVHGGEYDVVEYIDESHSGAADEISELRKDIRNHLRQIGEHERSGLDATKSIFVEYKRLETNVMVSSALARVARHMEISFKPHIDLRSVWEALLRTEAELREQLLRHQQKYELEDIDRAERDARHRLDDETIRAKQTDRGRGQPAIEDSPGEGNGGREPSIDRTSQGYQQVRDAADKVRGQSRAERPGNQMHKPSSREGDTGEDTDGELTI